LTGKEMMQAYVFQDLAIVVPENSPDTQIHKEISEQLITSAFGNDEAIRFTVPEAEETAGKIIRYVRLPKGELPQGWKAVPVRYLLNIASEAKMPIGSGAIGRLLRAFHIAQSREESRFCSRCGGRNKTCEKEPLALECSSCGRQEFPRISPAIMVIITNDKGEALLAHNAGFPSKIYALIAGFNEPGESVERTIMREVMEEVNIEVCDIRYICSQPWPFPNSLMLGFSARYLKGEIKPDGTEIADAQWFSRDKLPELPGHGSLSRYLIGMWLDGKL
jgi:NAD+ diphosphatase